MSDHEAPIVNGKVDPSAAAVSLMVESGAIASRALLLNELGVGLELPITGGSVSADSGSKVRRSGSITVFGQWSDDPLSRLTPYGNRVRVQRGIRVATGVIEWMTLMTGRIDEESIKTESTEGLLTLPLKDFMADIDDDRFDVTTQTNTAETVVAAITRLITETLPGTTVVDLTGSTQMCGSLDLQQDRAGGIDKLATSIAAEAFFGRDGTFIIRPQPTLDDTPRWSLTVGESGNLISVERKRTRAGTYNRYVARGESNDTTGTAVVPPSASAIIDDPADPLRYGGPFGRKSRFYTSSLLTTVEQCQSAANAGLERVRGRNYDVSFTSLVNPALDEGDVIRSILPDGVIRVHITDSVDYPLGPTDSQSVSTRTVELPAESDSAAA